MTSLSHHLAPDRWFLFRKSDHKPQSTTRLLTGLNRKVQQWEKQSENTHASIWGPRLQIGVLERLLWSLSLVELSKFWFYIVRFHSVPSIFGQSGKAALKITGSPLKLSCWLSVLNTVMDEPQELVAFSSEQNRLLRLLQSLSGNLINTFIRELKEDSAT